MTIWTIFHQAKPRISSRNTASPIIAEAKVAAKLEGKIPAEKLVSAENGKTYSLGDVTVTAIQGIHRGPIMLYQMKMDDITVFHGGDSGYVNLKDYPSQVAIVPVGRMSPTASPENAYKMVADVKPDVAITMHGSDKQKQQFEEKVKETMPQDSGLHNGAVHGEELCRFRKSLNLAKASIGRFLAVCCEQSASEIRLRLRYRILGLKLCLEQKRCFPT